MDDDRLRRERNGITFDDYKKRYTVGARDAFAF